MFKFTVNGMISIIIVVILDFSEGLTTLEFVSLFILSMIFFVLHDILSELRIANKETV